ncbi:MAG: colanic acid biosynthesis acetyltransferase WcaF [Opitutaceae bacterium]|nr:colanic acid biosynthesis acetyltransferase WcaF [Opitutaceae bacterium]MBP9911801.1 colanic acid biosynthesis acetyltransferase WcaF [Opitutaceae bacterium]
MPLLGQNSPSPWSRREKLGRLAWLVVQSTVFRWSPRSCYFWRNALLRIFGARIAVGAVSTPRIFPTVRIHFPWKLEIAAGVMLAPDVHIYNLGTVRLDAGVNISQRTHICAGTHDIAQWTLPLRTAPIHIGANTWIAAECFVGPGVSIGELAVIGARSVVIKNQPGHMICAGNPCRPIKPRITPV